VFTSPRVGFLKAISPTLKLHPRKVQKLASLFFSTMVPPIATYLSFLRSILSAFFEVKGAAEAEILLLLTVGERNGEDKCE
jgi:hypothetical protein